MDTHLRLHHPESVTKSHQGVSFSFSPLPCTLLQPASLYHSWRQLQTFPTCSAPPRPPCQQLLPACSGRVSGDFLWPPESSLSLSAVSKTPSVPTVCPRSLISQFPPDDPTPWLLSPLTGKHSHPPAVPKLFPA